jgi:hypothetical protein
MIIYREQLKQKLQFGQDAKNNDTSAPQFGQMMVSVDSS